MGGTGIESRMRILRDAAEQQILKPLRTHGWQAAEPERHDDGEYLVIAATKGAATRKIALLYSTATDNKYYKRLDGTVQRIFINGSLYHPESYAYGITTPVEPVADFFAALVGWNKELAPEARPAKWIPSQQKAVRRITSERPIEGIWARLDQLASITMARKLIRSRAEALAIDLSSDAVETKASGTAFALRNASEYYRSSPTDSLNKRIISLYYGTLALAFAEMLSSPAGPVDLDEVEGMTKLGHGLYTFPSTEPEFGSLTIGVLASGFFPRWASFLGYDISTFPKAKPKVAADVEKLPSGMATTLRDVLGAIPELSDLFLAVFSAAPSWVVPSFDSDANPNMFSMNRKARQTSSTYITLIDPSCRLGLERIRDAGWPLGEVGEPVDDKDGRRFKVRVDHAGYDYWHEVLPIHRSPFESRMSLVVPTLAGVVEYRAVALTVLYALSIMVRYMPSAWRRVEGGDWDEHLVLIRTAVTVFERLLPEQFLESILAERVFARQPGTM
jgi:hypothetical protein